MTWRTFGASRPDPPPPRQRRRITDPPSKLVRRPLRQRGDGAAVPDAATTDAPPAPPERIVVLWLVNRCPECGRRDFRTVRTVTHRTFTVREHRCRGCALKWRSMDRVDGEDVGR